MIKEYKDKKIISHIFIKTNDETIGELEIQDPRIDTIELLEVEGLPKDALMSFELQNIISLETDTFRLDFYTPNNVAILYYSFKKEFDKYKKTLLNHVLKNYLGEDYKEYETTYRDRLTMNSKMVYEMIQFANSAIIYGYTTIEAFANYCLKKDTIYRRKNGKGIVEEYDFLAIERWLSLSDKIKKIIAPNFGIKDISKEKFWTRFTELEDLRNSIIHSKQEENNLFFRFFNEKTLNVLESVNDLLNFFAQIDPSQSKFKFPLFDCNGKFLIKKSHVKASDVKNMIVGFADNMNKETTLKELLDEMSNKEREIK